MEEEKRIPYKLLANKDIEPKVQQWLRKVLEIRSKEDLVNQIHTKNGLNESAIIKMVGIKQTSYYRKPSLGEKGNKPGLFTFNESGEWVTQNLLLCLVGQF